MYPSFVCDYMLVSMCSNLDEPLYYSNNGMLAMYYSLFRVSLSSEIKIVIYLFKVWTIAGFADIPKTTQWSKHNIENKHIQTLAVNICIVTKHIKYWVVIGNFWHKYIFQIETTPL